MHILITGGSKRKRKLVRECIKFASEKILTPIVDNKITIFVQFKKLPEYWCASTLPIYYNGISTNRPKEFIIEIEERCPLNVIKSFIFHEMVHVKQHVKGHLRDYLRSEHVNWKGKKMAFKIDKFQSYFLSEWEVEAFGIAHGLIELHENKNKVDMK